MTKSEIFKAAHKLTRETRLPGDDYAASFSEALRVIYEGIAISASALESEADSISISDMAGEFIYTISADGGKYRISDNYGTGYGVCDTKKEAVDLVRVWTRGAFEEIPQAKSEFAPEMYGASGMNYGPLDDNRMNEGF